VLFDSIGVFLVVLVVALFAHSRRREFAADDHSFTRLLSTHPPTEERIARLVRRTNYRR
jgi:Zn-dependent protease with chaperone function